MQGLASGGHRQQVKYQNDRSSRRSPSFESMTGLAAGCQIDWVQLGIIIAGWFVAPLVSMCFASLLYFTVCRLTLSQGVIALKWRFVWLTLIVALAAFLIFLMVIKLVDKSGEGFSTVSLILLGVAPVLGIFASRIVIFCFVKPRDGVPTG